MQPPVSSLSASDRLVQPLRKDFLAVAQDGHFQRVTIPEAEYVQFASLHKHFSENIVNKI